MGVVPLILFMGGLGVVRYWGEGEDYIYAAGPYTGVPVYDTSATYPESAETEYLKIGRGEVD